MKKTISLCTVLLLVLAAFLAPFTYRVHADETIKVGSTVIFGHYEQDNVASNGAEGIKWRVLSIDEKKGTALLLSTYILDVGQFNDKKCSWESSYMRDWLNSYFLETAFSQDEQASLIYSKVSADGNPKYPDISNGSDTEDYVFLLSYSEAVSLLHYAESGYMSLYKYDGEEAYINTDMISFYTPYAASKGGYTQDFLKTGFWWCRTMGIDNGNVCNIANTGYASTYGHFITMKTYGIRPSVCVKLDSLTLTDDEILPYYGKDKDDPIVEPSSEESSEEPSEEPSVEPSEVISEEPSEEPSIEESSFPEESSVSEASKEESDTEVSEASEESESAESSAAGEKSEASDEIFNNTDPVTNRMWWLGLIIIALIAILAIVFVRRLTRGPSEDDED